MLVSQLLPAFPPLPLPSVLQFWMGFSVLDRRRNKLVYWTVCCAAGVLTYMFSLSAMGEVWTKKVPLSTKLLLWEKGYAGKVKLFLLPSSVFLVSDFLDPVVCWNFSAGPLDFHKDFLICGWFSESVFFWGEDRKPLFCHNDDITTLSLNLNAISSFLYIKAWGIL